MAQNSYLLRIILPAREMVPEALCLSGVHVVPSKLDGVWMFECSRASTLQHLVDELQRAGCAAHGFEDHYVLGELLGEGSFAQVYYAEEKRTGLPVAAKMVARGNVTKDAALMKEVCILRRANHQSVLKFHRLYMGVDPVKGDKVWIIVTEFVGGGELFDRVRNEGPLPEDRAASIIMQLLSALRCLHQRGIVHRDIKTENVILIDSEADEVKLVDFGLATPEMDAEAMATRCGTPGYIAPEVLRNEKYGRKVDCFSVGVLLYILLVGHGPFRGKGMEDMLTKNLQCKVDLKKLMHLSAEARDLVLRLLSPHPQLRLTAGQSLDHPWFVKVSSSQKVSYSLIQASKAEHDNSLTKSKERRLKASCSNDLNALPLLAMEPDTQLLMSAEMDAHRAQEVADVDINTVPLLRSQTPIFADMQTVLSTLRCQGLSPRATTNDQSSLAESCATEVSTMDTQGNEGRVSGRVTGRLTGRMTGLSTMDGRQSERTSHYFTRDDGSSQMCMLAESDVRKSNEECNSGDHRLSGRLLDQDALNCIEDLCILSDLPVQRSVRRRAKSTTTAGTAHMAVRQLRSRRSVPDPPWPGVPAQSMQSVSVKVAGCNVLRDSEIMKASNKRGDDLIKDAVPRAPDRAEIGDEKVRPLRHGQTYVRRSD
jgi:serine/threonine protein kinase